MAVSANDPTSLGTSGLIVQDPDSVPTGQAQWRDSRIFMNRDHESVEFSRVQRGEFENLSYDRNTEPEPFIAVSQRVPFDGSALSAEQQAG